MEILGGVFSAYVALGAAGMAVVGVALAATLFFSFTERGWQAFLGLAALLAGAAFFSGSQPWLAVMEHPFLALGALLGYFVAGSFWSVAKFRIYTGELKGKFREFKAAYLRGAGASSVEELDPAALASFRAEAGVRMSRLARHGSYPVKPQDHKGVILFWMGWWPVSMVAYLLDQPIKRLMELLYKLWGGVYAKIAADQAREYVADMGK